MSQQPFTDQDRITTVADSPSPDVDQTQKPRTRRGKDAASTGPSGPSGASGASGAPAASGASGARTVDSEDGAGFAPRSAPDVSNPEDRQIPAQYEFDTEDGQEEVPAQYSFEAPKDEDKDDEKSTGPTGPDDSKKS